MKTESDTTQLLESWLDEPEPPLDDRVINAAIDRLPRTPQRRPWWPFRRFPLGLGARRSAGAGAPHHRDEGRTLLTATRVAAGVALLALAGSLALIIGPSLDQPETNVPAAASPTPTMAPADGVHVSGRIDFRLTTDPPADLGQTTEEADGSSSYRGAYFQTTWTANDDRFTGRGEYTSNSNSYPADGQEDGVTVGWGTQSLTTREGTWTSRPGGYGVIAGDESLIPVWFDGGGGYAGTSALLIQEVIQVPDSDLSYFVFEGWIVPDDRHFEDAGQ